MTTLAEYRTRLDTELLTGNQLGRIHAEFSRLGFHVTADRDERLRITAALARVPGQLASTKDLTMSEAGRVIGLMTGCGTARELYALAEPEPEPVRAASVVTIGRAALALAVAWYLAEPIGEVLRRPAGQPEGGGNNAGQGPEGPGRGRGVVWLPR